MTKARSASSSAQIIAATSMSIRTALMIAAQLAGLSPAFVMTLPLAASVGGLFHFLDKSGWP
jgi:hypothetical protein